MQGDGELAPGEAGAEAACSHVFRTGRDGTLQTEERGFGQRPPFLHARRQEGGATHDCQLGHSTLQSSQWQAGLTRQ
jgi:hypothetical protein